MADPTGLCLTMCIGATVAVIVC